MLIEIKARYEYLHGKLAISKMPACADLAGIPVKAGIHASVIRALCPMDSRLRGNDKVF
jgi:hypothetical protein